MPVEEGEGRVPVTPAVTASRERPGQVAVDSEENASMLTPSRKPEARGRCARAGNTGTRAIVDPQGSHGGSSLPAPAEGKTFKLGIHE